MALLSAIPVTNRIFLISSISVPRGMNSSYFIELKNTGFLKEWNLGTDKDNIYQSVSNILSNKKIYKKMSMAHNPYGDGNACEKIVDHLKQIL